MRIKKGILAVLAVSIVSVGIYSFLAMKTHQIISEVGEVSVDVGVVNEVSEVSDIELADTLADITDESENDSLSLEDRQEADYQDYLRVIKEKVYYPIWMQPNSVITYDEDLELTIVEGGILNKEDFIETYSAEISIIDPLCLVEPSIKVDYDHHGFIQNIHYLWSDGGYRLSSPNW